MNHATILIFKNADAESVRRSLRDIHGLCRSQNFGIRGADRIFYEYTGTLKECENKASRLKDILGATIDELYVQKISRTIVHRLV